MQQFIVPQFIDVENKIFGPITVRQFIIILVAGLFCFIYYKLSDFSLFLMESILTIVIFGLFAFFRVNGQPLHYFFLNFTQTIVRPKLRIWNKRTVEQISIKENKEAEESKIIVRSRPLVASTRLEELALIIDTGGIYRGEE